MAGQLYVDRLPPKPKKRKGRRRQRQGWLRRLLRRIGRRHAEQATTAPLPPLVDQISHVRPGVWVVVDTPDGERIGTVKDFTSFYVRQIDENEEPIGEPFPVNRNSLTEHGTRARFKVDGQPCQIIEFAAVSVDVTAPTETITADRDRLRPATLADLPATIREGIPS